jgi:hypothetical protein
MPEVLIAVAVLAFAVAAIAQAISAGQAQTHASLHALRAVSLGEALMEEVLSRPHAGSSVGGGRPGYALMADYHGFAEPAGEVSDAAGVAYGTAYQRFHRAVSVEAHAPVIAALGGAVPGLRITVTVTDGMSGRTWVLTRFSPTPAGGGT